ncbi:AAA family ATPase [Thauera mechernichensis]|uniref:AAA family ATPase n=1 Tax=Thauera mechernichensis TaxID=82788 RepID=A0ABW3WI49_9RHOO|nr:AAA family ATPase [Thauera mechernichensis]MDG3065272.1 AAA family ATPase [Thauera mechernichensis]
MASSSTPPSRSAGAPAARQARLVALIVGGLFLLLIVAFVAMVFTVRDEARLNAVGPIPPAPGAERGGLVFHGTANIWEVRGRMTLDAERQVSFSFDLIGPTAQPAPATLAFDLSLDMPDHDRAPIPLQHTLAGPGSYVAKAALPEPGRWRLRLQLPEITGLFEFEVDR